ncbi:hypothetical protein DFQ28_008237 [Apophysomyces sp. BC1034]|nr:hypothetical protein DFQ30_007776 [Apophysomyces sp. BC1015]KAG0175290.1 hypothetical protein DFQ29_007204 [Apophysomyces sp. BC1021]KAG0186169.1 hypothetical protein DFQ28_008237 [Apophysomyces sp. BC1034]
MHASSFITLAILFIAGLVQALPIAKRQGGSLYGITYTGLNSDGSCQSDSQVLGSFRQFQQSGIQHVRTYSQECDVLPKALSAIQKIGGGMTIMAAIWIEGSDRDDKEIAQFASIVASGNIGPISGVLVGNEVVMKGIMSPAQLAAKIKKVKGIVGGKFQVATAEAPMTFADELIDASDMVVLNIHPYYTPIPANKAADNVIQTMQVFKQKSQGKEVVVGEAGWPSAGKANGPAIPSVANLAMFVKGMEGASFRYYFFEARDSAWKAAGAFGVETHYGLWTAQGESKV